MTDWSRERWRKLYVREPKDQEIWDWRTRGLRDLLIRVAEDDGRVGRNVDALRRLLRAGAELDEHVRVLLEDGFLELQEDGLYVRNLPQAQATPEPVHRATRPPRSGGGGRWAGTTPEERAEAARRASEARWGRRIDASGDASPDASGTDATTHGDASGDASASRAVSGSSEFSEASEIREKREDKSDQSRSRSDASATHAVDASTDDATTHRPRNLRDALRQPIGNRAQFVTRDPHVASYLEPHRWPEVEMVSNALCEAMARPRRVLASYDRDSGVRAVVALYAAGYTPNDLERAARTVAKQDWWTRDGARRGLSTLTPEVVDRALHDPADTRVENLVRSARESTKGPTPLGVALPKFAGGNNG